MGSVYDFICYCKNVPMQMGSEGGEGEYGRWRYTWEAQSHIPILRLLLFPVTKTLNPSLQFPNLIARLYSSQSCLTLTSPTDVSLFIRVPLPNVLLDADFPPNVRALSDHVEVKLLLLLPVDHPVLSTLLPLESSPPPKPLVMEYDVDKLTSAGDVDFYCRSCGFTLTKIPLTNFVEMPSANWREVADNWFGACCCSFGGISEKLVTRYANSHTCAQGMCLLSSTSATLCKDDLVECYFPEPCKQQECSYVADNPRGDGVDKEGTGNFGLNEERPSTCSDAGEVNCAFDENSRIAHPENGKLSENFRYEVAKNEPDCGDLSGKHPDSNETTGDVTNIPSCCVHMTGTLGDEDGEHHLFGTARKTETLEILGNQKSFLNGFLEDIFMARSSNLSKDIDWHEFGCPRCTASLGAYPCCEGHAPVDGGVRLFKCCVSTDLPVLGSGDIFSKYKLDRMFTNQLMECANEESSFRFIIRDLTTKSPALQLILLNPDTWSCSGDCSSTVDKDPVPKLQLRPVIKVLFSDCEESATESQLRLIEEWATKSSAENIFMSTWQIIDLVQSLKSAKDIYPPSCAPLQGFILSSLQR